MHWPVQTAGLRALIPRELEIDTFEGQAYVGLVPFTMTGVRPLPFPAIRPLSNFHEINVRTYVRRQGGDPGVWFFSLDAANPIAVGIARIWFKLPYYFAKMEMSVEDGRFRYTSERRWPKPIPAGCRLEYTPASDRRPAEPGTLDHFLIERYVLYSTAHGALYRGQVYHSPYEIGPAAMHRFEEGLLAVAGIVRGYKSPRICFSPGVDVRVGCLRRIGDTHQR